MLIEYPIHIGVQMEGLAANQAAGMMEYYLILPIHLKTAVGYTESSLLLGNAQEQCGECYPLRHLYYWVMRKSNVGSITLSGRRNTKLIIINQSRQYRAFAKSRTGRMEPRSCKSPARQYDSLSVLLNADSQGRRRIKHEIAHDTKYSDLEADSPCLV